MKKCDACSKPAVYHITAIKDGAATEFHYCEIHFHEYMNSPDGPVGQPEPVAGHAFSDELELSESFEDADQLVCPNCGITYREFREQGRFGCPHDYIVFREALLPLLENIHGDVQHVGKCPKRAPHASQQQYQLIKLRRELADAIDREEYEEAADLRDQIAEIEAGTPSEDASAHDE